MRRLKARTRGCWITNETLSRPFPPPCPLAALCEALFYGEPRRSSLSIRNLPQAEHLVKHARICVRNWRQARRKVSTKHRGASSRGDGEHKARLKKDTLGALLSDSPWTTNFGVLMPVQAPSTSHRLKAATDRSILFAYIRKQTTIGSTRLEPFNRGPLRDCVHRPPARRS